MKHLSSPQIWQLGVTVIDLEGTSCICASLRKLNGLIKQQGHVQCHFLCASEMKGDEGGELSEINDGENCYEKSLWIERNE